jgi:hypothetical protein
MIKFEDLLKTLGELKEARHPIDYTIYSPKITEPFNRKEEANRLAKRMFGNGTVIVWYDEPENFK